MVSARKVDQVLWHDAGVVFMYLVRVGMRIVGERSVKSIPVEQIDNDNKYCSR